MIYFCAKVREKEEVLREKFLIEEGTVFIPCYLNENQTINLASLSQSLIPGSEHFCIREQRERQKEGGFRTGYFKISEEKFLPILLEAKEAKEKDQVIYERALKEKEIFSLFVHIYGKVEITRVCLENNKVIVEIVRKRLSLTDDLDEALKRFSDEELDLPERIIPDLVVYIFRLRKDLGERSVLRNAALVSLPH